jgi:hypothetical protein
MSLDPSGQVVDSSAVGLDSPKEDLLYAQNSDTEFFSAEGTSSSEEDDLAPIQTKSPKVVNIDAKREAPKPVVPAEKRQQGNTSPRRNATLKQRKERTHELSTDESQPSRRLPRR